MSAVTFTPRQREILRKRIERAICWRSATAYARSEANSLALVVLREIEDAGFSAGAQRRAVEAVVASLDGEPLASMSPAERDVKAALDNADFGSGSPSPEPVAS